MNFEAVIEKVFSTIFAFLATVSLFGVVVFGALHHLATMFICAFFYYLLTSKTYKDG